MKIVVGLGNPGRAYEFTRHNFGFMVVDELARMGGWPWRRSWLGQALRAEGRLGSAAVMLLKPQRFMNRSGPPVAVAARRKGVPPAEVLVVYDDLALPTGELRLRGQGGAGGHNGLTSVLQALGTQDVPRLRLGIGPCPDGRAWEQFVLAPFAQAERPVVQATVRRAAEAVECVMTEGLERAMNRYNGSGAVK
ncbi:MAG: aminoacyl-tRNA hydrolase [Candidatus Marinimicrobia bacterium]|nr:aminoacyl-tRNA hydrolase [Candidatus Neomarinimicrobiota bacterium]